ncbi:dipeptidase PepE [Microbacterium capsulatum]|uniref:Dipeptidase PepE n=1 Tax=Microbacterium capsulatum TaxID=3041921 RepID=A0ABU0XI63_9MICO|nr:dipeptidase PepE [Microbacterium sp. ASV81]MDQ4213825.1 dipeptidase PepE [Microbacterium sp. ASV81]
MNLLLMSNSSNAGSGYLAHAWDAVREALGGATRLVFVPYALADRDAYTATARTAFAAQGVTVTGAHESGDPVAAVRDAEAVFVGGGNTFRLLKTVRELGLIEALRAHAAAGRPYLGASAGTNLAAATIRTTNDMPIVEPGSFDALGLVPFQINAHYLDADPTSTHAGETRAQRLAEFHEENDTPVLALREGAWLRVRDGRRTIGGTAVTPGRGPAVLFRRGAEAVEIDGDVTELLPA